MSPFGLYFQLGFEHITDIGGYDHILFVIVLCAAYRPADWRRLAWLITAFTVGHSLTLSLTALGIPGPGERLVELAVAGTIIFTALLNLLPWKRPRSSIHFALAAGFGLVHGWAFSNFFRSLQLSEEYLGDLLVQLFAFNLGVEVGQLLGLAVLMATALVFINGLGLKLRYWTIALSLIGLSLGVLMLVERF